MKKLVLVAVSFAVFVLPLQAIAGYAEGDYFAGTRVELQLAGPYTRVSSEIYGDHQPAFASSPLGSRTWMDVPPGSNPHCGVDPSLCHNMYVGGYAEADLTHGILKTSASSWVNYNYTEEGATPNAMPNGADISANLRNTLFVTVPGGVGKTYHLGVNYDVAGTMSGTPQVGSSYGRAEVYYVGHLWAQGYGEGEGTGSDLWWTRQTTASEPTPFSTAGEFGMDFAGEADPITVRVLLTLTLSSTANVYGILPGRANSDFGSTAHASLTFDPELLVRAESAFPGAPVPGPLPFLLLSSGLAGLLAVRRRFGR